MTMMIIAFSTDQHSFSLTKRVQTVTVKSTFCLRLLVLSCLLITCHAGESFSDGRQQTLRLWKRDGISPCITHGTHNDIMSNNIELSRNHDDDINNKIRSFHRPVTIHQRGGGGWYRRRPPLAFAERDLWALRIASAGLTYLGFVAYADRPKGPLLIDNPTQSLQIKPSLVPGAGLGLFAGTTIRKGTVLGEYPGVVIPLQQNLDKLRQYPMCEGYVWRFSDNQFVIDPTDRYGNIQDVCLGGNPSMVLSVAIFSTLLRFVSVPTTLCRINEPPKGRDVNVITEEDLVTRKVTFIVERDVYEGEEFYIDYGLSYDRSMYGAAGGGGDPQ